MMFTLLSTLVVSTFTTTVCASTQYPPFYLQLGANTSASLNHQWLYGCTTGNSVSICSSVTIPDQNDNAWGFDWFYDVVGKQDLGNITWLASTPSNSQMFTFADVPGSNWNTDAIVFSEGGDVVTTSFDENNRVYVAGTNSKTKKPTNLYRWYMCETEWDSQSYNTLNWLPQGQKTPNNPTCVAVDVFGRFG